MELVRSETDALLTAICMCHTKNIVNREYRSRQGMLEAIYPGSDVKQVFHIKANSKFYYMRALYNFYLLTYIQASLHSLKHSRHRLF